MNKTQLLARTKPELLEVARRLGLRGISTLTKAALAERILAAQERHRAPQPKRALPIAAVARKVDAMTKRRAIRKTAGKRAAAAKPAAPAKIAAKPTEEMLAAAAAVATHKFEVAPPARALPQSAPPEQPAELPASYGTGKLFAVARDPRWLYAYWDFTDAQMTEFHKKSADGQVVLRVFEKNKRHSQLEVPITPEARNWYINVDRPGIAFLVQLGYYRRGGGFEIVSRSNEVATPAEGISADTRAEFVTFPLHLTFHELTSLVREHVEDGRQLAYTLSKLQQEGFHLPVKVGVELGPWTPQQATAMKQAIGGDVLRRTQAGSEEIGEWLRRQLQGQVSSAMFSGGLSSAFSPGGASWHAQPSGNGFWFAVNAELIIYGATEPDAKVTIDGQPVQLRPDGTFSFHYVLPDGQYRLPIVVVSRAGDDRRAATLRFYRHTTRRGAVGAVQQPGHLQAPSAG